MPILADAFESNTVTDIVTCEAADDGYLTEAIQINGKWYSAAKLDFSNVSADNISQLNGKGFSFNCSMSCSEAFDFKFVTDGTASSATDLSGSVCHKYVVDISGCNNGSEVLEALFNFVQNNPPQNGSSTSTPLISGAVRVSHSNEMIRDGSIITIYENWQPMSTESEAESYYPREYAGSGVVDCSSLIKEPVNEFHIQCSSNVEDVQIVQTPKVNAKKLRVNNLILTSYANASSAITKIANAIEKVSKYRSQLGASNNRLETSYRNAESTLENIQRSESLIRDTDMAEEMVKYSASNILVQAGNAILAQNNQKNRGIVELLLQ